MVPSPIVVGDVLGNWTVLREVERARGGARMFLCQCDCGTQRDVRATALRKGYSKSCGCSLRSHGHCASNKPTATYRSWAAMLTRATNPNSQYWSHYGGRGITVCERWQSFENFLADMGERSEGMTLDRINPDGNYEPGNCRWATHAEQVHNQRARPARACEHCGELFVPRQYHGRFCSPKCRNRARWLRERPGQSGQQEAA